MAFSRELKGSACVFGDNLDVDWDFCDLHALEEMAKKGVVPSEGDLVRLCLARVDANFSRKAKKGDFIVAGKNTGYSAACLDGMPEDPHMYGFAQIALKALGIAALLCESVAANFQRNSLDHGLPVVECKGIKGIVRQGEELLVNFEKGTIDNLDTGAQLCFTPFPHFILEMLEAGGLYSHVEKKIEELHKELGKN